ncbi:hypothetical protein Y032_0012g1892 [Ancylostoma ceylanicum]|uniref:Acyl-CoA dehydrogenase, middle domain protein n=1 Tax=Ancylostoma ceylanicum TaxID=53326 RepID=A0A016VFC0_9BILA|nr:hypothetical protein Y032_0012g1892 [Ancylostoma ceylanicum]
MCRCGACEEATVFVMTSLHQYPKLHTVENTAQLMSKAALRAGARAVPTKHHMLYTEKHMEMRRELRKLIERSINPHVQKWEEAGRFPAHAVFKQLGNMGVLAVSKPPAFGGLGLDFSYSIAVAEELGSIDCAAIPMSVCVQTHMATPALAEFGSDSLRSEFLTPSMAGDLVACIAVSEPEAGSDVAAIRTTATRSGSDLIINGHKMWITNGAQADWACVLVNTSYNSSPHRNKSLVCVRLDEPGVHRTANLKKLGMHSSDTAEIFFDDVRGLKTPGYRSPGGKGAPAPNTTENAGIRDHQWSRGVLAGSSVKNAKDMGPPIQKGGLVQYCGKPRDMGPPMEEGESALRTVGNPWLRRVVRSSIA